MKDKICLKLSNILPKRLVMWCAIKVVAYSTTGPYSNQIVPDLTAMDAIKRFSEDHRI